MYFAKQATSWKIHIFLIICNCYYLHLFYKSLSQLCTHNSCLTLKVHTLSLSQWRHSAVVFFSFHYITDFKWKNQWLHIDFCYPEIKGVLYRQVYFIETFSWLSFVHKDKFITKCLVRNQHFLLNGIKIN